MNGRKVQTIWARMTESLLEVLFFLRKGERRSCRIRIQSTHKIRVKREKMMMMGEKEREIIRSFWSPGLLLPFIQKYFYVEFLRKSQVSFSNNTHNNTWTPKKGGKEWCWWCINSRQRRVTHSEITGRDYEEIQDNRCMNISSRFEHQESSDPWVSERISLFLFSQFPFPFFHLFLLFLD